MPAKPPPFDPWPAPHWSKDPEEGLEHVRCYVEKQLDAEIGWYRRAIRGARRFSRFFRAVALLFTALGGLVPVIKAAASDQVARASTGAGMDLGQVGYVFLAVAGGFALFDRFFGFSTGWMRYVVTMLALEKLRESFRLEWSTLAQRATKLKPTNGMTGNDAAYDDVVQRLLETSKRVIVKAKEQTEKETEAWISEFKANLTQLEKDLRAQLEASRPGAIDVRIKDGAKAPSFELSLDQMVVETATGSSASAGHVSPGLHKITVSANVQDKTYRASQIVNVSPAEVTQIELDLGIP